VTVRILIADDDQLVRTGLRLMIETQDDLAVVGEAGDGREAIDMAHRLRPDVVLMDIRMPGIDGIEATREIVATSNGGNGNGNGDSSRLSGPRVLILTTFELDEYVYEAVRAGASGFLLKRTPPEDLLDGLRLTAAGEALLAPSVTKKLMGEFARTTHGSPTDEHSAQEIDRLTEREREVLVLMARGHSNREIAAELYVAESTVKTHVKRVLMKLDLRDRVHAVVFAYESGLLHPGDASAS
jgi:DNA-binding NarL/FixJ family response regulator